jgi:hypothetical protein
MPSQIIQKERKKKKAISQQDGAMIPVKGGQHLEGKPENVSLSPRTT